MPQPHNHYSIRIPPAHMRAALSRAGRDVPEQDVEVLAAFTALMRDRRAEIGAGTAGEAVVVALFPPQTSRPATVADLREMEARLAGMRSLSEWESV